MLAYLMLGKLEMHSLFSVHKFKRGGRYACIAERRYYIMSILEVG